MIASRTTPRVLELHEITRLSFTIGVSPCNRKSCEMKVEREEKKEPREADRLSHNHVVRWGNQTDNGVITYQWSLDKGIEKASYELGTILCRWYDEHLISPDSRRERFLEYRERLALLNERAIDYLLSSISYRPGQAFTTDQSYDNLKVEYRCGQSHYLSHSPKQNHLQRSKATKEGRRNIVAPPL